MINEHVRFNHLEIRNQMKSRNYLKLKISECLKATGIREDAFGLQFGAAKMPK
jgi:hypothetical protein